MTELISRTTRGLFRDLMSDTSWQSINAAFQDEGFAPSTTSTYQDSSVRRRLTQQYLEAVDWSDAEQVRRVLRVFERLLAGRERMKTFRFFDSLRRDGFARDVTGHITPIGPQFSLGSLASLTDASAIREQLGRIQRGPR